MSSRVCRLFLDIENGATKRYQLTPLPIAELGPEGVVGFRLINRTDTPEPIYFVRLSVAGKITCTCPAFHWDDVKGKGAGVPPDQPPPSCKHCEALHAAGLLPFNLVQLIGERTRLLDAAEKTIAGFPEERAAAGRNTQALRDRIAELESSLRAMESETHILRMERAAAKCQAGIKPRRTQKAKAA